jgi:hypothetical protein
MANSSGGNSGNRRPKGSGNRSSSARRSGSPQSPGQQRQTVNSPAEDDDDAAANKSADERARERLANRPAGKKGGQAARGGGGSGGRKGPPSRGKGGQNPPKRNVGALAAIISSGVVAVFVVVVVLVSVLGGSSTPSSKQPFPLANAPASLVASVTHVPASSFATADVGNGQEVEVTDELDLTPKQPAVTSNGLPELVYVGAEGCPYCAAARWPLLIALSRFGTFSGLGIIKSSPADAWANTNTFSFLHSSYKSNYLVFSPVEEMSNVPCGTKVTALCTGGEWQNLQTPTAQVQKLANTYDSCTYFPNPNTPTQCSGIPFMDWGGKYVSSGGWYLPSVINPVSGEVAGQGDPYSWSQIAKFLTVAGSGEGQTILAAANIYSALICNITNNKDTAVCNTAEVKTANKLITAEQKQVPAK